MSKYIDALDSINADVTWHRILEEACNKAATYDEQNTAKDVIRDSGVTFCPSCKIPFVTFGIPMAKLMLLSCCPNCGQRIHIGRK